MASQVNKYRETFTLSPRVEELERELFYEFAEAFKFWHVLVILMAQSRTKTKVKGLLFTGESDSGKSTLVYQFAFEYLRNSPGAREDDVVIFNVPQGVGAVQVFAQLCRDLGIPDIPRNPRTLPITHFVLKAAAKLKADHRLLIVDEFQNLLEVPPLLRKKIISAFNQLINASRIPIVLVGVTGASVILEDIVDDHSNLRGTFSSRFPEFALSRWQDDEAFQGLLVSINQDLPLELNDATQPFYQDERLREGILTYSRGLLGRIVTLVKQTAIKIISEGHPGAITLALLEEKALELGYIEPRDLVA